MNTKQSYEQITQAIRQILKELENTVLPFGINKEMLTKECERLCNRDANSIQQSRQERLKLEKNMKGFLISFGNLYKLVYQTPVLPDALEQKRRSKKVFFEDAFSYLSAQKQDLIMKQLEQFTSYRFLEVYKQYRAWLVLQKRETLLASSLSQTMKEGRVMKKWLDQLLVLCRV